MKLELIILILSSFFFLKKHLTYKKKKKKPRKILDYLPKISFDLLLENNVVGMFSQDRLYLFPCVGFNCI